MALSKKQISLVRSLRYKKYRNQYGLFLVEGEKVVTELLSSDYKVREIYVLKGYSLPIDGVSESIEITEKELRQISQLKTPNKVLAVAEIPNNNSKINFNNRITIALYELNDPGNFGTIIRTADWFGVSHIICSKNSVDIYNPKVIQSSMGSVFRVNVQYVDLEKVLQELNLPILAASTEGKSIYGCKLPQQAILLFGSESHGVPEELLKLSDDVVSIPKKGNAESLNVGVAVGLICSQFSR